MKAVVAKLRIINTAADEKTARRVTENERRTAAVQNTGKFFEHQSTAMM